MLNWLGTFLELPRICSLMFFLLLPMGLNSQFVTFFHSLLQSLSKEVQIFCKRSAGDIRSNSGANIAAIKDETGLDPWVFGAQRIKEELKQKFRVEIMEND